jgi:hypothetical protein
MVRALVNTGGQDACRALQKWTISPNASALTAHTENVVPGAAAEKPFVRVRATLLAGIPTAFNMAIKGFGWFGDAASWGCVASVVMHYRYLSRTLPSEFENNLLVVRACATASMAGSLSIANQVDAAVAIADSVE